MALRYNELLSDRTSTLDAVFNFCGNTIKDMEKVRHAFEADAHEGELTAHSRPVQKLSPDEASNILRILANPRVSLSPDAIL